MFSWIPIHREAIHKILEHREKQDELLAILREMTEKELTVISLQDKDAGGQTIPLAEIDPFTFLASFNRGVTNQNRRENWKFLKARWSLKSPVPDDFAGIPVLHNMSSWLFPYAEKREKGHIELLWQLAAGAADGGIEDVGEELFDACLKLKKVGIASLTIGQFWINPEKFLPADNKTVAYGKAKGTDAEPTDYGSYRQWLKDMAEQVGDNYPQVSHAADLFATQNQSALELTAEQMQMLWSRFHKVIKGFTDFQSPGSHFSKEETGYKRAMLEKFQKELGSEKLSALVTQGEGLKGAKEIARLLTSNIVNFRAWDITLGKTDEAACDVLREYLKVASSPYHGPESTDELFNAYTRQALKPSWDALTVLLWALRPDDFFPVKISYYRKLGELLDFELPSGRPNADRLNTLIEFGRAFWTALQPQKPADWVDVQSFIWCVCPGAYSPEKSENDLEPPPEQSDPPKKQSVSSRRYWTLAPGHGGEHWEEFYKQGIAAIGWDGTTDLRQLKSKDEIRQVLQELFPDGSVKTNDALACWQFANDIKVGDVIFAKRGLTKLLGYGVVQGDYDFDAARTHYRHVRKVNWLANGEWEMPEGQQMPVKTLTDMTPYPAFIKLSAELVGLDTGAELQADGGAHWWLNANPKMWNFEDLQVGQKQTYTSHNEKGNKRRIYDYFLKVKAGDLIIGYVTSPQKEVVAVCKITKGLHETGDGAVIEFEKVEQLTQPIAYETLQAMPDLANSEPLLNNQGSLFKLTGQEYEAIRSLIDETNIPVLTGIETYDKKKAMKGLFLAETQFDEMLSALKEKKNVVLQGAPGVGKTYVAKRLAFALVESNDPLRTEMIQFHQSYSYEDFIQGFRPTPSGHFALRYGIFHQFCRRAQRDEAQGKPYVFIIDEINRGNLSKIFGELMMLIESDKRGKQHAIPLAYSQNADEKFYIPENLHIVGMMNTADRSLAMVDYALRRRFRFITLRPEFETGGLKELLVPMGATVELVTKIIARMTALNTVIASDTKNLGPGYQIGHSYFCPRVGIKLNDDWYERVINSEIVPLIREYWFDNEQKVKEQEAALLG